MRGKLRKLTERQVAKAVKEYDAGKSLADLAKIYCISRQAMWDLMKRRTKLRSRLKSGKENHFYRGGKVSDDRAHNKVEKAIKRGDLLNPEVCETCGSSGRFSDGRTSIQAHHDDYNFPLKVRWLCQPCHHEWHRNNTAIRKKGR